MSIRVKIFFVFLVSATILMICGGAILYFFSAGHLKYEVYNTLTSVAQNKVHWINSYLSERRKNLEVLAKTEDVRSAFEEIIIYYEKERFSDLKQERYRKIYKGMDPFFRSYLKTYGYHDILFLSAAYGHVLYTAKKETPLGTNLKQDHIKIPVWQNYGQRLSRLKR